VVLEFLRNFLAVTSPGYVTIYTIGATSFILVDVVLLSLVAASFYYRPSAEGGGSPLLGLLKRRWHAFAFSAFMAFIVWVEAYLLVYQPFTPTQITNIAGVRLYDTVFTTNYVDLLFVVLILFVVYPSGLLLLSRRRTTDKGVRRALLILPVCWCAIGLEFLIFNGYLLIVGIDASSLGYLIGAAVFLITARIFRQATTFATLFGTVAPVASATAVTTFSSRLGVSSGFPEGRLMLFETSSSTDFEKAVLDFIKEVVSTGSSAFVFTSKGSPVYDAVSKEAGVRVYVFSSAISYPKETEKRDEILVPANDVPILLDVMSKFISVNPGAKIAIIFDSLSDIILSLGLQECYKLVRQASAILNLPTISSIFLLTLGAHDDQTVSLIKSLFPNHLLLDQTGLKITRSGPKFGGAEPTT
jgi:hypothetical protein